MECPHIVGFSRLDCEYSCSHHALISPPDEVVERHMSTMMKIYEENLKNIKMCTVRYGDPERDEIDIWGDENDAAAAFVVFHGGYWKEGDRRMMTSMVKDLTEMGVVVASVGYSLAPAVPISTIIEEAVNALRFLRQRWPRKRIAVGGHSAGAHIAVSVVVRTCTELDLHHVVVLSGLFDLHELPHCCVGKEINLTEEEAARCSIYCDDFAHFNGIILQIVAQSESTTFSNQANYLLQLSRSNSNVKVEHEIAYSEDHFSLIEHLSNKELKYVQCFLNFFRQLLS
ncbi:hypothetical protein AB6A40_001071 [Gnathostoma spinigerum]|uniref:Alpha/beta hydrolase fold-3 domain-containing protein n=1 Tax=Gnathostoma spinigerum TaxID=75299 RepID=A0ABD6ECY8_9BILA